VCLVCCHLKSKPVGRDIEKAKSLPKPIIKKKMKDKQQVGPTSSEIGTQADCLANEAVKKLGMTEKGDNAAGIEMA
jgi:hypothetical protein